MSHDERSRAARMSAGGRARRAEGACLRRLASLRARTCIASLAWGAAVAIRAVAQPVAAGNIAIGLVPAFNAFSSGVPGATTPPIDVVTSGDGPLYVATLGGQILASQGGVQSLFLDLTTHPNVPFTAGFAATVSMAFHPDYATLGAAGYRKFYTYSSDFKTTSQVGGGSNVAPGSTLTGLPDFWPPEMYAPAASGNPLTNWTNPFVGPGSNTNFDHFNVVREWTATADGLAIDLPTPPRVVLRMAHGFSGKGSHNGGGFRFGPDGYLYLSTGDGGGNSGQDHDGGVNNNEDGHTNGMGNAQDRTVIYGKVLRIDPTAVVKNSANGQYGIPADNPYVVDGSHPDYVKEIYAYGFRNPWKLSFDDRPGGDGALYVANAGQHHREEIERVAAGGNFGWGYLEGNVRLVSEDSATGEPDPGDPVDGTHGTPIRAPAEGWTAFTAAATPPLADYLTRRQNVDGQLVGEGTAATGGVVYRGAAIPELYGKYVFGDYSIGGSPPPGLPANKGRLFYLDPDDPSQIVELSIAFGNANLGQLLGIGDDDAGELYALFDNGNVVQLVGLPPGDFDRSGAVDADDLNDPVLGWKARFGVDLDGNDLLIWQRFLGQTSGAAAASGAVPEPGMVRLATTAFALLAQAGCRRRNSTPFVGGDASSRSANHRHSLIPTIG